MAAAEIRLLKGTLPVKTFVNGLGYFAWSGFFASYLDHDHPKRKYIGFFAVELALEDFRCSVLDCETVLADGAHNRVHISCDIRKAEVHNSCVPGRIDQYIRLYQSPSAAHHRCGKVHSCTYSFEVSVDHIARVKVIETFSNAEQLRTW